MNNKCTLLIDGNWLLQSRFSVLGKFFKINNSTHIKQTGTNELVNMMAKSINIMLNRFPFIDNMILVSDGGSWRKNIQKPSSRAEVEYKGNRETQEEFDWNYIWPALKILSNNFVRNNITYSCSKDIEGDDWIWYWSKKLSNVGTNCIIWSSDNDLKQLVTNNVESNAFVMWYNDKCGGYLHNSLEEKNANDEDMLDFFLTPPTSYNPTLEKVKSILKSKISYIYPSNIILSKVMCGDAGDNIKPAAVYVKNGRNYGLTQKMWEDISETTKISTIQNLIGNENLAAKYICEYKNFKKENVSKQVVLENIKYNIQLVWLDKSIIPEYCLSIMDKCEYKTIDINMVKHNYKTLCDTDKEIENIAEEIESLFD